MKERTKIVGPSNVREQIMYNEMARYYDVMYSGKDYKQEAEELTQLIMRSKRTDGLNLLEAGCGTGNYLGHLNSTFSCTGIDISKNMLQIARRKKFTDVKLIRADMTKFSMAERFDAVLCLFGVISYVKTYSGLRKTIEKFSEHLKPGGVVVIEPHFVKPRLDGSLELKYEHMRPYMSTLDSEGIKIARLRVPQIQGDFCTMDIHILIAEGSGVKYVIDHQEIGLFAPKRILKIMDDAGIDAEFRDEIVEQGLYVGVKRGKT